MKVPVEIYGIAIVFTFSLCLSLAVIRALHSGAFSRRTKSKNLLFVLPCLLPLRFRSRFVSTVIVKVKKVEALCSFKRSIMNDTTWPRRSSSVSNETVTR